jgi:cyclopropane-fatty-acyl-phospholipid synthase
MSEYAIEANRQYQQGGRFAALCQKLVLRQLKALQHGYLVMRLADEQIELGDPGSDLHAVIDVFDPEFFVAVTRSGSVGAAESFMAGDWHCTDLTALVRILVRNRQLLDEMEQGMARVSGWLMKILHAFNRNSRSGSQRNIAAHYDLGNELFSLFLDKDWMMYSSALYLNENESLEQAQANKLQRLCDKLELSANDHLVEIGSGWGGCAMYAASRYGCKVTTITISQAQYEHAKLEVEVAGLSDKVTVLLRDYRDLEGQYDKLISIEMVEAVGHHYLDNYFECCARLLRPGGRAIIQAITLEDHRYQQALSSVDFIKRYIFPGSFIPCVTVLSQSAAKSELRLVDLKDLGDSYATTLREWRHRFLANLDQVREQGYPESFIRMWLFYLCYCEGGFIERSISDVHMLFEKPLLGAQEP